MKLIVIFAVLLNFITVRASCAELPVCGDSIIREVTNRTGCNIGDTDCWLSRGGYCTDYIGKMTKKEQSGENIRTDQQVRPNDVRKGDVAVFSSLFHTAYVDDVVKDKKGRTISVNLSEYNYGSCWVDKGNMVSDNFKVVSHRSRVPVKDVDGGFFRP